MQQAAELMGERKRAEDFVFKDIYSPTCTNNTIQNWVLRAGIDKKITFHGRMHTFATMILDIGTNIYMVSKLLGHCELSTTQIYAKVLDKNNGWRYETLGTSELLRPIKVPRILMREQKFE